MQEKRRKTRRKRVLAMLLSICMMATLLPVNSVRAEESENGSSTATETVSYVAIEGTEGFNDEDYANLVDGDTSNKWCLDFYEEAYIIFKSSVPLKVTGYSMTTGGDTEENPGRNPKSWTLYGANEELGEDADGWKKLDTVTDDTALEEKNTATTNYTLKTEADNEYTYFMLKISAIKSGSIMQLAEFALEYTLCDHIWEQTDKTTEPGCTQPGGIILKCSKCQTEKIVTDETRPAAGHHFAGERCNRCGAIEKRKPVGEGTAEDPYQIGKASELYWFAGLVNGDKDVCTGDVTQNTAACAVLTADITVNAKVLDQDGNLIASQEGLAEWKPIGRDENSAYAAGAIFDGQGHCIKGLYCNQSDDNYIGLFGYTKGKIMRVGVKDVYIAGNQYVGGIFGFLDGGSVRNCYAIGTIEGQENTGGLGGYYYMESHISDSYSVVQSVYSGQGLCLLGLTSNIVENCYYGPDAAEECAGMSYQSTEAFESGKVAYLLQHASAEDGEEQAAVWGQDLSENGDAYPVFDTKGSRQVYRTNGCVTYSNDPKDQGREKEHTILDTGICQDCGRPVDEKIEQEAVYLDEKGKVQSAENVKLVTENSSEWTGTETAPAWYMVRGEVSVKDRIRVSGDVHLILADGCKLQAEQGIHVGKGNSLTIHAQSDSGSAGMLTATGKGVYAGIGSGFEEDGGEITICGGIVNATGESESGIGSGMKGEGGKVTICGGIVTATGYDGAGIGGGYDRSGGEVTIQGGIVTATGYRGAGIGGGYRGDSGTITIRGGVVTATGYDGAGIGGGYSRAGESITICGGIVTATGYNGAGIGNGDDYDGSRALFQTQADDTSSSKGTAVIFATSISDTSRSESWNGLIVYNGGGGFYGDMTEAVIEEHATIPSGGKLIIGNGKKLTIKQGATLTNNGRLEVESGGSLINQGTLTNNKTLQIASGGTFDNSKGILRQNGSYNNLNGESAGTVKKRLKISKITAEDRVYDGTNRLKVTDVTLNGMDEGDDVSLQEMELSAIVYDSSPETYTEIKSLEGRITLEGEDAGKYYVDLTQDHPSVNGGRGVTISKHTEKLTWTVADRIYLCTKDHSESMNIAGLFDADLGSCDYVIAVKVLDEEGTDIQETVQWTADLTWDYMFSYTIKAGEAGKRKLVVEVETANYQKIEIVVEVTLVSKYGIQVQTGSEVTADQEGIIYGQSLSELKFNDTIFTDEYGNVVPGTLSWKDPSYVPERSTVAAWVFTPVNQVYATLEGEALITVQKKKTRITEAPVAQTTLTYGQKLSEAVLKGGSAVNENGENVSGRFEWKDPEQVPTVEDSGKTKYTVVFKPDQADEYGESETGITVTVKKADQTPENPGGSGTTTDPENPGGSGTTTDPENPGGSGTTTTPENPGDSGTTTTPENPGDSQTATTPGTEPSGTQTEKPEVKPAGTKVTDATGVTYKVTDGNAKTPAVQYQAPKTGTKGTVTIPASVTIDNVTYKVTSIADNAFKNNKKIKKVVIGNNIVSIGKNAFAKCSNLTSITIGKNVTKIGKNAFSGCKKLKTITVKTKKLTKKSVAGGAFNGISKKVVVKVPKSNYKAYQKLFVTKGLNKKAKMKKN